MTLRIRLSMSYTISVLMFWCGDSICFFLLDTVRAHRTHMILNYRPNKSRSRDKRTIKMRSLDKIRPKAHCACLCVCVCARVFLCFFSVVPHRMHKSCRLLVIDFLFCTSAAGIHVIGLNQPDKRHTVTRRRQRALIERHLSRMCERKRNVNIALLWMGSAQRSIAIRIV